MSEPNNLLRPRSPAATRLLVAAGAVTCITLALSMMFQKDVISYNGSPSMPVGFYLRIDEPVRRGAIVTVRARDVAREYAAQRDFTGPRNRFLKRVVGLDGDRVCADGADVRLNGVLVAHRLTVDSEGRRLPSWSGCVTLRGAVFLLGQSPRSFDGRYWGPTPLSKIEGLWRPIGAAAAAAPPPAPAPPALPTRSAG